MFVAQRIFLTFFLIVVSLTACSQVAIPQTNIRLVNLGAGNELELNGTTLCTGVKLNNTCDYLSIRSGNANIKIFNRIYQDGKLVYSKQIYETNELLEENESYTVIANLHYLKVIRDESSIFDGQIIIRFGNTWALLYPLTGAVDVYLIPTVGDLNSSKPSVANLLFREVSDYSSFIPGTYNLIYTYAGSKEVVSQMTVQLVEGNVYTALTYNIQQVDTGSTVRPSLTLIDRSSVIGNSK
jgi:hypothetical protein